MFAPFGTPATNLSATWHPEPRGRGTFNILSTCLTTMILCVWTAVHLNIPDRDGGTRQKFLRKPGWLLMALLAPEIVAWNAWEQRKVARELTDALVRIFGSGPKPPPGWIRRAWAAIKFCSLSSKQEGHSDSEQGSLHASQSKINMVHGFYAAMGGFAVKSQRLGKAYTITGRERFTLSCWSVFWLLRMAPELFPDLSEDEILDKSKASTLVKALTCLQALWFCLQCIVRLTMKTSISLLELNVFVHCVCTFIIYALWWNKPMDISEPTILRVEDRPEFRSLIALLCSYPKGEVPRLPPPLDECFLSGQEYNGRAKDSDPRTADEDVSLDSQQGRQTQSCHLSRNERSGRSVASQRHGRHHQLTQRSQPESFDHLDTQSDVAGSPSRSIEYEYPGRYGPEVHDDEKQIDECAGLRIERLRQLLKLDESDPYIKISIYEHATKPNIRFTVGTGAKGLTYYLSRDNLKQLGPRLEESGHLETSAKMNEFLADDYHLERSYLTWLDKQWFCAFHSLFPKAERYRPRSAFVNRIDDWTIRLMDGIIAMDLSGPEDPFELIQSSSSLFPQISAMSAAALVYGGFHLLAWNAPFRAPFVGMLWKISGITIASLGLAPSLMILTSFMSRSAYTAYDTIIGWLTMFAVALLWLGLFCFTLLYGFARVYLVVESFLSLAYLPESTLTTPNFSLYFPHIG